MHDWRIKYYSSMIISEYNKRIVESYSNKKFVDSNFVNRIFKKEKAQNKQLGTVDILKNILHAVKEGKYDKN